MVEIFALVEPLICKVSVSILNQWFVYWEDILLATYSLHIRLCCIKSSAVTLWNREGIPSLANFWIDVVSDFQVLVDSC